MASSTGCGKSRQWRIQQIGTRKLTLSLSSTSYGTENHNTGFKTALDLAVSSRYSDSDDRHDFVGLHNIAKHIIYLKENSEAASMTMTHLETFHRALLIHPPQGQDAMPTMHMTSQMLVQKAVQFEVWKLRMTSLQQRMQNVINLVNIP